MTIFINLFVGTFATLGSNAQKSAIRLYRLNQLLGFD
jgi:hypothetical protein